MPRHVPSSTAISTLATGPSLRLARRATLLLLPLAAGSGCVENWKGLDIDGDGYGVYEGDCWDSLEGPEGSGLSGADIHPGATEKWYDGIDQNCDKVDDYDPDGDGWVKEEAHMGQATLGISGTGEGHQGFGDCYNTPEDLPSGSLPDWLDDSGPATIDLSAVDAAAVNPGMDDAWYDGIDANCDGADDFDADVDGDRSLADGGGSDCDDTDPKRAGTFEELCDPDGIDEDCDELVNGADDSVDPETAFPAYVDVDLDGFGDPATEDVVCDLPAGMVAVGDDCDDTRADVNPDADEVCDDDNVSENCDDLSDDDDPQVLYGPEDTAWTDADGDGFGDPDNSTSICDLEEGLVRIADDCDDTNGDVNPSATEVCNDIDDDCDSQIDDDDSSVDLSTGTTFYVDADTDGYGNPDVGLATTACDLPLGYTTAADATDCDDSSNAVNPGATEVCNSIDDDCDTDVDDADSSVSYGSGDVWYADSDGDDFGNASSTTSSCAQPADYVRDNTDCNDANSAINPDMDEICDGADTDEDCNGVADDADSGVTGSFTTFYADTDSDGFGNNSSTVQKCDLPSGYVEDNTDCNDGNSAINPDADEVCDSANTDEDCNGLADNNDPGALSAGFTTFYADSDTDGYGDISTPTATCDLPSGYVTDSSDCDDTDIAINPSATEVCDGADNDCNGDTDDDDAGVDTSTFSTFYLDADSDGYGVDGSTTAACNAPSGYAEQGGDCDDSEGGANPGETEVCNDGLDADCDPTTCMLESDAIADAADVIWRGAENNSGFGYRVAMVPDVTGDGKPDAIVSAYVETWGPPAAPFTNAGTVRIGESLDGAALDAGIDKEVDADTELRGDASADRLGTGITGGDFNGDGQGDLIVGAVLAETNPGSSTTAHTAEGQAYLLLGPISAGTFNTANAVIDATAQTNNTKDNLGWAAASGDINGDAYADLAVSAPECIESSYTTETTDNGSGVVFMLPGDSATTWFDVSLGATAGLELDGTSNGDCAGFATLFVDIDGSGTDELIVGAPFAGTGGELYVVDTSQTGNLALSDEIAMDGWTNNHDVGTSFAAADMDNDGLDDLVVGAPGVTSDNGAVYIVLGDSSGVGSVSATTTVAGQASAIIEPPASSTGQFGYSVATGDFDNDGNFDLVVGAWKEDPGSVNNAGTVWVAHGPLSGSITLNDTTDAFYTGESAVAFTGNSVAAGEDLNGDGFDDILVGAFTAEDSSGDTPGAAYFLFGRGN